MTNILKRIPVTALMAAVFVGMMQLLTGSVLAESSSNENRATATKASSHMKPAKTDSTENELFGVSSGVKVEFNENYEQIEATLGWDRTLRGWLMSSTLNESKKKMRGRDMDMINEMLRASATKINPNISVLAISLSDNYSRQTSVSLSQYGKEIVIEQQRVGVTYKFNKPLIGANKSEIAVASSAARGQQDFKYSKNVGTNMGGFFSYFLFDKLIIGGGGGAYLKRENSDVGPITFSGINTHVDTLRGTLEIMSGENKFLKVTYSRKMGKLRQIDPPLGNSLQILDNPEDAKEEEEKLRGEDITLRSTFVPLNRVKVEIDFSRNYSDQQFRVEERRNKEYEAKKLEGGITYKYGKHGSVSVNLERAETDTEYGPTSVASYQTKKNLISFNLKHAIHDSLDITLRGATSLDQKFYKKKEQNPRDADYIFSSLYGRCDTYLFRFLKTSITGTFSRREEINIDASLSGDNRTDYQYYFIPEFSFKPLAWMTLGQKYEIKLDYTEFTYYSDKNYLNRNTTLVTDVAFSLFKKLRYSIEHRYNMKDTGSYKSTGGEERLYSPASENIENRLNMIFNYTPLTDLNIFIRSSFRGQNNNMLGSVAGERKVLSSSSSQSGSIRMGFERKRDITKYGEVDLDVAWIRNFGPFISDQNREYWEIQANVEFNF